MDRYDSSMGIRIKTLAAESKGYINLLNRVTCIHVRNILLNQLNNKLIEINYLSNMLCCQVNHMQVNPIAIPEQNQNSQRDITIQELSKFNGKDGNPAYVAVNGTVYDVTNNAAWAAASHFGLTAGKDLTGEFASCHAGQQQILSRLKVVGKIVAVNKLIEESRKF